MMDRHEVGRLVQDYVRAKWRRPGTIGPADDVGQGLDPALRERIDLLGTDDERLLLVRPEEVIGCLTELEHEAWLEDVGAGESVKRFRSQKGGQKGVSNENPRRAAGRVQSSR